MNLSYRHRVASGPKAGEWGPCSAQIHCRNEGVHVSVGSLNRARDLLFESTGVKYSSIARIPLEELKKVLHADEIKPTFKATKRSYTPPPPTASANTSGKQKKVVKHFNEGSLFTEIAQAAFGQSDYEVAYPFRREISFHPGTDAEREEVANFIKKENTKKSWDGPNNLVNVRQNKKGVITNVINSKEQLKKWIPIETHYILAILANHARKQDKKKRTTANMDQFLKEKHEFIEYLKDLGIKELLD